METAHATTISRETGRVSQRGRGLNRVMVMVEFPIRYRPEPFARLSQRPREEALCVIQRNLSAQPVRLKEVERVLGPRNLEQHRRGANLRQAIVELAPEARVDDVIAGAVDEERGRDART